MSDKRVTFLTKLEAMRNEAVQSGLFKTAPAIDKLIKAFKEDQEERFGPLGMDAGFHNVLFRGRWFKNTALLRGLVAISLPPFASAYYGDDGDFTLRVQRGGVILKAAEHYETFLPWGDVDKLVSFLRQYQPLKKSCER